MAGLSRTGPEELVVARAKGQYGYWASMSMATESDDNELDPMRRSGDIVQREVTYPENPSLWKMKNRQGLVLLILGKGGRSDSGLSRVLAKSGSLSLCGYCVWVRISNFGIWFVQRELVAPVLGKV